MIRSEAIKWGVIVLLALFAFMFLPAHEYFTSSSYKTKNVYDERTIYSPGLSRSDPPVDDILGGDKADSSDGSKAGAGTGPGAMYGRHRRNAPKPWFVSSPEDNYVEKSSLVPCTCTTHSMGCAKHAGGREHSRAPGDHDYDPYPTPDQYGIMKPFSSSFLNQEEPSGFLNTFNAFMR
jgi:hypothetical protein